MTKMCGYWSKTDTAETIAERVRSMLRVVRHDRQSIEEYVEFANGAIGLIRSRSIEEQQTQWNDEGSSCLALCGHTVELQHDEHAVQDGERFLPSNMAGLLLQAFEHQREATLERLNGVFAFAYVDTNEQSLTIVNDRYGFMPLYYYCDDHKFVFASEVKAVLRVIEQREFDLEAWGDFFYIGHMMGERTLFKHVHALAPGQVLTYRDGKLRKSHYYDFTSIAVLSEKDVSTDTIAKLFMDAVRKWLTKDSPNTVLLSGGFDSRLILGALHAFKVAPRVISLEHASATEGLDGTYAMRLAEHLGLACDYRQTRPWFRSSPESVEVFYILDGMVPSWELFIGEIYPEIDSGMGRIWDGLALDVALGGSHQSGAGAEANLRHFIAKRSINRWYLRAILRPRAFHAVDDTFMSRLRNALAEIPASENQFLHFLLKNRTRRRIAINPHQLFASKVEPVTPAVDRDFLDYVLAIPKRLRLNHRIYIDMLKQHFPSVTQIPIVSGGVLFNFGDHELNKDPSDQLTFARKFVRRTRKAVQAVFHLVGSGKHTKEEHRDERTIIIRILERKLFDRPIYNTRLLRRLFAAYRSGSDAYHTLFTLVFYIELWHLLFVDEESPVFFNPRDVERWEDKPVSTSNSCVDQLPNLYAQDNL